MTDATYANLAHLFRRAGFGATGDEIRRAMSVGYDATVDALLDRTRPDAGAAATPMPQLPLTYRSAAAVETVEERKARGAQRREQRRASVLWWLERMYRAENPLTEKVTFFWHGHFATSTDKVNESAFMLAQNDIFRRLGGGSFEALTQAVAKDPAMMIWLDANQNRKGSPNENFARELMELFTIGIGNYTDGDVREAARAFTGWRIDRRTGAFSTRPRDFDADAKTILGQTRSFTGEDVISLLATSPAAHRFLAARLWTRFAYPIAPDDPMIGELVGSFATDGNVTGLLRRILLHPNFVSTQARTGLVKQPVEYAVGALRALGVAPSATTVTGPNIVAVLGQLNQVPFDPPSVGGWPNNGYWLSTATSLARVRFARQLAQRGDLSWLRAAAVGERPALIADRLGIDRWTDTSARAIRGVASPVDQLAVALVTPEYLLN
jgi:uncharacterized protein (DUF1800 family)